MAYAFNIALNAHKVIPEREMVIPGFAGSLEEEIKQVTGWNVNIGPLCCGELPLYFGEDWVRP